MYNVHYQNLILILKYRMKIKTGSKTKMETPLDCLPPLVRARTNIPTSLYHIIVFKVCGESRREPSTFSVIFLVVIDYSLHSIVFHHPV